jgi:hypothetical protein
MHHGCDYDCIMDVIMIASWKGALDVHAAGNSTSSRLRGAAAASALSSISSSGSRSLSHASCKPVTSTAPKLLRSWWWRSLGAAGNSCVPGIQGVQQLVERCELHPLHRVDCCVCGGRLCRAPEPWEPWKGLIARSTAPGVPRPQNLWRGHTLQLLATLR